MLPKIRLNGLHHLLRSACDDVTDTPCPFSFFLFFQIGISNLTMELYNEETPMDPIVPPS